MFVKCSDKKEYDLLIDSYTVMGWKWNDGENPRDFNGWQFRGEKNFFLYFGNPFIWSTDEKLVEGSISVNEALMRLAPSIPYRQSYTGGFEGAWGGEELFNRTFPAHLKPARFQLTNKKKPMISTIMKKLLDSDTKSLVKAGYLDSELDLTCDGQKELLSILLLANKKALVTSAEEKIKEDKEDCDE